MYDERHKDNAYHKAHYGSPAEFGYKDICGLFSAEKFDPEDIIRLVQKAGGKYFLTLANHHDNFDNFDSRYQPDLVCFDESVGNLHDLGAKMGLGLYRLSPWLLAHYYNLSAKWHGKKPNGVMTMKDVSGAFNSVGDENMYPILHQAFVNGIEKGTEEEIADYPFQTEDSLAEWHYQKGMTYKSAEYIICQLADVISRNGNLSICIPQHADGSIDPDARRICELIGAWMDTNGEAVYETRPFEVFGEEQIR